MCGICGFIGFKNDALLDSMTAALTHRGPDADGFFRSAADDGPSLGMRRLKVIDLETGDQPIYNEDRTVAVIFNGEIYNFRELRGRLEKQGHIFRTKSDTEVIVHLYEELGEALAAELRGMFAFALWDAREKKLLLVRDHFGIKPLFYSAKDGKLIFSSELTPIVACGGVSRRMDYKALDRYFSFLYIPQPLTIYEDVKKLPPAHMLVWRRGAAELKKYWSPPPVDTARRWNENELAARVFSLIDGAVEEQSVSDVPLGVFLSGGLDSGVIAACLAGKSSRPVKTFTVGFSSEDASYDERRKARAVADHLHTDHEEYLLTPDLSGAISRLAESFGEPFADSSAIPTYCISKTAREKITVSMTGIGGDEIFAGYPRHLGARLSTAYEKLPRILRAAASVSAQILPEGAGSRNLSGWAKRFARGSLLDFRRRYLSWMSFFLDSEKKAMYSGGFPASPDEDYALSLCAKMQNPEDMLRCELVSYLPGDLLCLADRASMANSLELRVPLLDLRLVEEMCRIPLELKTKNFTLKYILKLALKNRLPGEILSQRKMGFQMPLARWINEEIKEFIDDNLAPSKIRKDGFLKPEYVAALLARHRKGGVNNADKIYAVLMFNLWLDRERTAAERLKSVPGCPVEISSRPPTAAAGPSATVGAPSPARKKILLVNLGGVGDAVMMSPLAEALRRELPAARIDLLTIPRSVEISRAMKVFDDVGTLPVRYRGPGIKGLYSAIASAVALRRRRYDVMINLRDVMTISGRIKMSALVNLINPAISIGRVLPGQKKIYDIPVTEHPFSGDNEVVRTARLLEPLGVKVSDCTIRFEPSSSDRKFVEEYIKSKGAAGFSFAGVHPGSFRPSRRWPVGHWREMVRLLVEEFPEIRIFVTGGGSEKRLAEELKVSDRVIITNGELTLGQSAALYSRMKVLVTNDSGPMHLAAAAGANVVAIFGPGDVLKFTPSVPPEKRVVVRKSDVPCARPCYKYECPSPACLVEITPAEVFAAARRYLI